MVSAKVLSWKHKSAERPHSFGIAVTPQGETVLIPWAAIVAGAGPGAAKNLRLQVGAQVNIDVGTGKSGRPAATKCTGPGVVTWDEWTASRDENNEAAKAAANELKEIRRTDGYVPPARTQQTDHVGVKQEKRKDVDGKFYTKKEFVDLYKGYKEWNAAEARGVINRQGGAGGRGGRGGAAGRGGRGGQAAAPEKRMDTDGKYYTKEAYLELYGGFREWNAAAKRGIIGGTQAPGRGGGRPAGRGGQAGGRAAGQSLEKRRDTDGKYYTREEFLKEYGGLKEWIAAAPRSGGKGKGKGKGQLRW
eukprot:TRINITY_DN560_c0_g1_i1.p2 TRINITY_DN560_c0_g1~~TRINITY_DN560_c0_g1_i1.p2  ORF type:complete len:329 (+),score=120.22 TRINITY_DN560_c0_g1_i1:77-988(+)